MRFKEFFNEGRNPWMIFSIKKNENLWSFKNEQTGKWNLIKINKENEIGSIQKFLEDILATPPTLPKTKGEVDYHQFATEVVAGKKSKVYVKSGKFEDIQKTWILSKKF